MVARLLQGRGIRVLEVWGRKNSFNVQKVLWCCEELDVAHERVDAGGPFGGTRNADYLAMNPNGLVPTISDDGFSVWESNTIVRYLSARYGGGVLWAEDPADRSRSGGWTSSSVACGPRSGRVFSA